MMKTARSRLALALLSLAALAVHPRAQDTATAWTTLTGRLDHGSMTSNAEELKAARAAALRYVVSPVEGISVPTARYTVSYADYRLANHPDTSGAEQADYLDEADQQLREAIRSDATFADAYGLLSAILSLRIARASTVAAKIQYGPESGTMLDRGFSLEPSNPRLLIIQGVSLFHRPAEHGGDPQQAEVLLRRAVDAADKEAAAGHAWPNWGRFDGHFWLGQVLAARGDIGGARSEYGKALVIAPDANDVRKILAALAK
jgi:tetratricopeptide (TPR) repeat protein